MELLVPASVGELIDKITILEIKSENIEDPAKLSNVKKELSSLMAVVTDLQLGYPVGSLASLGRELSMVNRQLWSIEDDIRDCERRSCFDQTFVDLARSVYRRNDERARLKKMINLQTGSALVEEKSYASY